MKNSSSSIAIIRSLSLAEIRERLEQNSAERQALLVLLRAAQAADRRRRNQEGGHVA